MKKLVFASSIALLTMSILFILSWHLGFSAVLQLPPSTWPIPYTAALCLLLSGIALFSFFRTEKVVIPRVVGGAIFLLGFQRAAELYLPSKYCVLSVFHLCPTNSSQMVMGAAIGFMLVGAVFLCWPKQNRSLVRNLLIVFVSMIVIFLGAFGLFLHLLPDAKTLELNTVLLHFYTAMGLFLVGLGFIVAKFHLLPKRI